MILTLAQQGAYQRLKFWGKHGVGESVISVDELTVYKPYG